MTDDDKYIRIAIISDERDAARFDAHLLRQEKGQLRLENERLTEEIERLRAENERLRADLTQFQEMAGAVRLALRHVGEKP